MNRKLIIALVVATSLVVAPVIAGEHDHGNGDTCPASGKTIVDKAEVEMTGEVLCLHCDLDEADSCHKIFMAAGDDETRYELCPNAEVDISTMHGPITVVGQKVTAEDGSTMLRVESVKEQPADS